jgi:enoyl-CoA hydratase/carnithine racemase
MKQGSGEGMMGSSDGEPRTVILERSGFIGWLTLNRPESINAINEDIRSLLPQLLRELEEDRSIRVIAIRGSGTRGFCVGADLKEERPADAPRAAWIETLTHISKPLIASIQGYCLGGGLELAMACDLRIASMEATFGLPEPAVGLIPGGGGTQRLPRLVGLGRALDLLITAERVSASEAHRIGLISRLVETGTLSQRTEALARHIASLPPLAVRLVKMAAHRGMQLDFAAGLQLENELFGRLLPTQDRHEAARAFREKREPTFTGS